MKMYNGIFELVSENKYFTIFFIMKEIDDRLMNRYYFWSPDFKS